MCDVTIPFHSLCELGTQSEPSRRRYYCCKLQDQPFGSLITMWHYLHLPNRTFSMYLIGFKLRATKAEWNLTRYTPIYRSGRYHRADIWVLPIYQCRPKRPILSASVGVDKTLLYSSRMQTTCARKNNEPRQDSYLAVTLAGAFSQTSRQDKSWSTRRPSQPITKASELIRLSKNHSKILNF